MAPDRPALCHGDALASVEHHTPLWCTAPFIPGSLPAADVQEDPAAAFQVNCLNLMLPVNDLHNQAPLLRVRIDRPVDEVSCLPSQT